MVRVAFEAYLKQETLSSACKWLNKNGYKIAYYEHSWNTKRNSTLFKKTFQCEPKRVLAKKLEPLVWAEAKKFVTSSEYAKILFEEAETEFKKNRGQNEEENLKTKICV